MDSYPEYAKVALITNINSARFDDIIGQAVEKLVFWSDPNTVRWLISSFQSEFFKERCFAALVFVSYCKKQRQNRKLLEGVDEMIELLFSSAANLKEVPAVIEFSKRALSQVSYRFIRTLAPSLQESYQQYVLECGVKPEADGDEEE